MSDPLLPPAPGHLKRKLFGIYGFLLAFNVLAWVWAVLAFRGHPLLLGTAFLAYSFGLRHAVDADHLAAIDNATRKLMQAGQRPVAVGFFFSLGHSSVVVLASVAIAVAAIAVQGPLDQVREVVGIVGTLVSVFFLFAIAILNIVILRSVYRVFCRVRNGGAYVEGDLNTLLAGRGFLARMLRPLFRLVTRSWHMYPLGFLFGLGFDTATEIAVLGISATQASQGLPVWSIMVFPVLFTAGMSLVDTLDSTLMLGAYGWAYVKPIRKLYYNMTITLISVVIAILVGGVEALGLLADRIGLSGQPWDTVAMLNSHFGMLGYAIIGIFVASWLLSVLFYRMKRYDRLETAA
ncbi:HoxN/HupN/NixA family nickel/cobalt transporter [Herbaspirillum sp. RTI4]|uniref:HoxN/HupN/NixA family nickel/cobalt transporter n=1 Tax=Herbaspirillum sp. RTI4 TaxID=3048640 RepID=UPI002AB3DA90|nr:HoxN/HupN/NixA family nickel/cobalt transporter [Herbaspirillum sp. RTI4]MDY7577139.1 HoxN/HupN/NixA family nickel/cobalt transporter [Herbaspirillum sp. RTI4]MEA9980429.1 HoxN/HupN/NixA family nickel/cobalt transporter [Herbaspirillum sp. RTI4]